MHRVPLLLAAITLALAASACGTSEPRESSGDELPEELFADDGADSSEPLLGEEIQTALDAFVAVEGVEREDVEIRVAELVTWPDGALGCPEPDRGYTQALVDGYRIVLAAEGVEAVFHGEEGGEPFRCEDPGEPVG